MHPDSTVARPPRATLAQASESARDFQILAERLCDDSQLQRLLELFPSSLQSRFALSDDELDALRDRNREVLVRFGLSPNLVDRIIH